ncbi:MAG: hypothetical protein ACQESR_30920, partial [Planctomycetota bacterium]
FLGLLEVLSSQYRRNERRNNMDGNDLEFFLTPGGGPVDKYAPAQQRYKDVHQNFRMAMAAPADLPEFQDNVAAVWTEKYWDMDVVELRAREKRIKENKDEINDKVEEGKLSREEGNAALEKLHAKVFTPRELSLLPENW